MDTILKRLGESVKAVFRTQVFLERRGVEVDVPAIRIREKMAEIAQFTQNEADILLMRTPFCIEVKGRPGLIFREALDIHYEDVSVDTVSGYLAKSRKPLAYVMVSGDYEGGIVLPTFTHPDWEIRRTPDHRRKITDDFYFADKRHFVGRRRWLIDLCRELQSCSAREYDPILLKYGFPSDDLGRYRLP